MKRIIYSFVGLLLVTLMFSCKQAPEKMVLGSWKLDSVAITNLDEVVKYNFDAMQTSINDQVLSTEEQIKALDPKDKKNTEAIAQLQQQKASFESEKQTFTAEMVKDELLSSYTSMKGFAYTFNEDKTFTFAPDGMGENGNWTMAEDGKTMTVTGETGYETTILVQELTENKLTIKYQYNYEGIEGVFEDVIYYFVK